LVEREILDLDVLDILEGKKGRHRKRNKSKDKYEADREDWNYCFEGINLDQVLLRIIITINNGLMPIITVMRLN
jgi:hypothetical protein